MDVKELLQELESLGSEQTRNTYRRHGIGENQFGVSYANLGKLQRRIRRDHQLALSLWETGNHDARVLATMVADPEKVNDKLLDSWVHQLDNYPLTDALSVFTSATPLAKKKAVAWKKSKVEWIGRAGWIILARLANEDKELPDSYFEPFLDEIERGIHSKKNRVREAMNTALIAIGIRSPALRERAQAVAAAIGKVEVEHGETNCKTPDAADYIRKAVERRKKLGKA